MFDLKLTISDIYEIVAALKFESDAWAGRDGGNKSRQRLIDEILLQYRAQLNGLARHQVIQDDCVYCDTDSIKACAVHPDAQIPDSIYAPDPEDFEEVIHNAD